MKTFDSLVLALLLLVPSFLVRADPPLQLPVTNAIPGVGTNSANLDWAMDLHANVALQCVASLANIGTSNAKSSATAGAAGTQPEEER